VTAFSKSSQHCELTGIQSQTGGLKQVTAFLKSSQLTSRLLSFFHAPYFRAGPIGLGSDVACILEKEAFDGYKGLKRSGRFFEVRSTTGIQVKGLIEASDRFFLKSGQ